jgi:hypothetical protein
VITLYKKQGFELMENKDELLKIYGDISDRQIETAWVLGKSLLC